MPIESTLQCRLLPLHLILFIVRNCCLRKFILNLNFHLIISFLLNYDFYSKLSWIQYQFQIWKLYQQYMLISCLITFLNAVLNEYMFNLCIEMAGYYHFDNNILWWYYAHISYYLLVYLQFAYSNTPPRAVVITIRSVPSLGCKTEHHLMPW